MNDTSAIDAAEAQLQQELREMFTVDTQQHLETYFSPLERLNPQSWTADIQQLYRAIHTIKGGAVTVAADAMLQAAIVLEDLLSDLRYLEEAPVLADGQLVQILIEAGELLSSSIEIIETGDRAIELVQPTVNRLTQLRDRVKQLYLPEWNELKQVHQEFAEQGFDLVVLDLEMALGRMPERGVVLAEIVDTAQATISQLAQIGVDLELPDDWGRLLQHCERLIAKPDPQLWRSVWFEYFQILKNCAKNSGKLTAVEIERLADLAIEIESVEIEGLDGSDGESSDELSDSLYLFMTDEDDISGALDNLFADEDSSISDSLNSFFLEEENILCVQESPHNSESNCDPIESVTNFTPDESLQLADRSESIASDQELPDLLDNFFDDEVVTVDQEATLAQSLPIASTYKLPDLLEHFSGDNVGTFNQETTYEQFISTDPGSIDLDTTELIFETDSESTYSGDLDPSASEIDKPFELSISTDDLSLATDTESTYSDDSDPSAIEVDKPFELTTIFTTESAPAIAATTADPNPVVAVKRSIQIPVPLERLDKSAQQVVDTLLTARGVMNISSKLQSQLLQLTSLTRENAQFVTRLRQLQDDYALLRNLSDEQQDASSNVTLERYRQGYATINRLLENILRLSELGQEIESSTYQSAIRLDALDRSILKLKDGIETSRLVPFRNLSVRAKAILRDLTNRYGKPAQLVIENEQIELDAGIVQQLEPALLHLLRNAFDHGLESSPQRLAAGKPAQGKIRIAIQHRGTVYRLILEDDGGGIDPDRIQQLAKSKGFALTQTRTNAELLTVLCQPGFSSSSTITDVSGRGVGMDVVVSQIASIGGKLSLDNNPGSGCKFSIEIPAPQLSIPCVLFQVGDRIIALPTDNVLETALLSSMSAESISLADGKTYERNPGLCTWSLTNLRGELPGFDLYNYWQPHFAPSTSTQRALPDTAVCIRTQQAEDTPAIWSIADDLLGQAKLPIDPLPSPLISPVGLLGVSLQPDGRLISILDPIALSAMITSTSARSNDSQLDETAREIRSTKSSAPSAPTILIVDDAAMIRRRLEASLNTYGFVTYTCADGLEALNWLQTNPHPDLMITDVEMPNMDGFTLIDRARQAQIDIPILVVSSRLSEEWGKEARRLGATDYLNKGFATSELIHKVNALLGLLVDA